MANQLHNISTPQFAQHAHEIFAQMRADTPVVEAKLTRFRKIYLITRYADVQATLKDARFVKNPNNAKTESGKSGMYWMPKQFRPLMSNMLNTDEPDHRRLRNLVHKAFTPARIRTMHAKIEKIADELLDEMEKGNSADLVKSFALPLPVAVIAEMIGIPRTDWHLFEKWTSGIMRPPSPLNLAIAVPSISNFIKYARKLADERRRDPQDDLMTALVQAEDDGEQFTEDELLGMVFLLVVAGHETTVGLIANGTNALLNNPEQLDLLRSQPELIDTAIEELLRYDGPLQSAEAMFPKEPVTLHGVTIPQGAMVLPAIVSANRDETVFENANTLDITRSPNPHLAFGNGIHYCLGAPLARMEAQIAFRKLIERFPDLRFGVTPDQIEYQSIMMIHRVREVPIAW